MYELVFVIAGLGYGAWDAWRRYLKHQETLAGMRNQRQDALTKEMCDLRETLRAIVDDYGSSAEKNRIILKTFLDSITDMVKLGEEDKQHLLNKLNAAKLGKK